MSFIDHTPYNIYPRSVTPKQGFQFSVKGVGRKAQDLSITALGRTFRPDRLKLLLVKPILHTNNSNAKLLWGPSCVQCGFSAYYCFPWPLAVIFRCHRIP